MPDVVADLFGVGHVVNFRVGSLDFNDPARGKRDSEERSFFVRVLQLVGSEQPAVRQARAAVLHMDETADFWFEHATDGIEEIGERAVAGSFLHYPARGTNGAQFAEVRFRGARS